MSDQIREQVSAFLDGELPGTETELLLKRLTRDAELRERFGRYALIGESLRGSTRAPLGRNFTARVNKAIDGEPAVGAPATLRLRPLGWWRPVAGAAMAAGVAAVAVVALQHRAVSPGLRASLPVVAVVQPSAQPKEAISYTVPAAVPDAPAMMPSARLTNYVFAHSKYSTVLGQSNVIASLLGGADEAPAAGNVPVVTKPVLQRLPAPQDPRTAP
jgi:sigma-E factor negative regulatory protein RseA